MGTLEDWERREQEMLLILSRLKGMERSISKKDNDLIYDFIVNREFAVALEWLVSLISERKIEIGQDLRASIENVAAEMDIPLDWS